MQITAADIARRLDGEVLGDGSLSITGFAPAETAREGDLTFAENDDYFSRAEASAASAMSLTGLVCMLGLGGISTSIAYWLWGRLLRDYPAAQVVPFALLVPFVGSAASSVVFGETFGPLRLAGMVMVVGGIAVMLLSKRATSNQIRPKIA